MPIPHLHETATLIAFHHPRPSYPVHVLLVPRRPIGSMKELDADDAPFMVDLFATVRLLVDQLHLEGYRLICNGGAYQDVSYLHFHLIAGDEQP